MSHIAVAVDAVGLHGHARDVAVDLRVTGNAVGIDHVACRLVRWSYIVAHAVAKEVFQTCLGLERDLAEPVVRGVTVVTGSIRVGAEFMRQSRFTHNMADGTELALIRAEHGIG